MFRDALMLLGLTGSGLPEPLPPDPLPLFAAWFEQAQRDMATPNPDAMLLATAAADGSPSARVVLCKAIDTSAGSLVFFTNYSSRKGRDLSENPRAAATFHWDRAGRQARVEGPVQRVSAAESDEYFRSRPLLSRIGAWASLQSAPLSGREELLERVTEILDRFGVSAIDLVRQRGGEEAASGPDIPRPENWGGYRILALRVELWQGVAGRLHDRAVWSRADPNAPWRFTRLHP